MKTAMQELIAQLKERRSNMREAYKPLRHLRYVNDQMNMLIHQITIDIEWAELMLEKEKKQIKESFLEGSLSWATGASAKQYYKETYKTDEV